jgi:hypothetical protein
MYFIGVNLKTSLHRAIKFTLKYIYIFITIASLAFVSTSFALLIKTYSIPSSGSITYAIKPLHTDGRYIKDVANNIVVLRGLWKGGFATSCSGSWDPSTFAKWNEQAAIVTMADLKSRWGINIINVFFWADWWINNSSTTLGGYSTDVSYRTAIKESIRIAQGQGLYVQLRLYGISASEGRVEGQPYPPYTNNNYVKSADDFINFWSNFAYELKDYPNVIFALFDEPSGDQAQWFDTAHRTIDAIRARGVENLIVVHWAWCGSCDWMETWIKAGMPIHNILFSNHIYRYHGTFGESNPPTDKGFIRAALEQRKYKYITETYNIPIWISAMGAYDGVNDDSEYVSFRNTLDILNEWNLSYCGYMWDLASNPWNLAKEGTSQAIPPPNRVGQALIDAIDKIPAPNTYTMSFNSQPSGIEITLDDNIKMTPFVTTLFGGSHTVSAPPSKVVYSHSSLFGNTLIGDSAGYHPYLYTSGPYTIDRTVTVNSINFYSAASGKARVALYNELNGSPNRIIAKSVEMYCTESKWNSFDINQTTITPGKYFLAIKISTNLMLSGTFKEGQGKFRSQDYLLPFPDPFGPVDGGTSAEYSIYIPYAPLTSSNYQFVRWEDGSTNPTRTINLTANMDITSIYR